MIRLFENAKHVEAYALVRPSIPQKIVDITMEFLRSHNPIDQSDSYNSMIDVGCGSGQSTLAFSPHFKHIIGIDPSEKQIELAKKNNQNSNILYQTGTGENLNFAENIDLVTSSQAVHWMDIGKFFSECHKVLQPNGCLLMHGYDVPKIYPRSVPDHIAEDKMASADRLLKNFYKQCLFHPRRFHVDDHYQTIFGLLKSNYKIKHDSILNEKSYTLAEFISYLNTWSGYRAVVDKEKEKSEEKRHDILFEFVKELKKEWDLKDTDLSKVPIFVAWEIFAVLSERPFADQDNVDI